MIKHSIIDSRNESFILFKKKILISKVVGLNMFGNNVGRDGTVCWILIDINKQIFLLDVVSLGCEFIFSELKDFFENTLILKVIHDCRCISEFLWHKYSIQLNNIFDIQVADVMIYRAANKNLFPKELKSLYECIVQYLTPKIECLFGFKKQLDIYSENSELLLERPVDEVMIKTLLNSILYLKSLRQVQLSLLLKDFNNAVTIHRAYFRDALPKDLHRLKTYSERVPIQFNQLDKFAEISRKKEADYLIPVEQNLQSNKDDFSGFNEYQLGKIASPLSESPQMNNKENKDIEVTINCQAQDLKKEIKNIPQIGHTSDYCCSGSENRSNMSAKKLKKLSTISPTEIHSNIQRQESATFFAPIQASINDPSDYLLKQKVAELVESEYLTKKLKSILHIHDINKKEKCNFNKIIDNDNNCEFTEKNDQTISVDLSSPNNANAYKEVNFLNKPFEDDDLKNEILIKVSDIDGLNNSSGIESFKNSLSSTRSRTKNMVSDESNKDPLSAGIHSGSSDDVVVSPFNFTSNVNNNNSLDLYSKFKNQHYSSNVYNDSIVSEKISRTVEPMNQIPQNNNYSESGNHNSISDNQYLSSIYPNDNFVDNLRENDAIHESTMLSSQSSQSNCEHLNHNTILNLKNNNMSQNDQFFTSEKLLNSTAHELLNANQNVDINDDKLVRMLPVTSSPINEYDSESGLDHQIGDSSKNNFNSISFTDLEFNDQYQDYITQNLSSNKLAVHHLKNLYGYSVLEKISEEYDRAESIQNNKHMNTKNGLTLNEKLKDSMEAPKDFKRNIKINTFCDDAKDCLNKFSYNSNKENNETINESVNLNINNDKDFLQPKISFSNNSNNVELQDSRNSIQPVGIENMTNKGKGRGKLFDMLE